MNRSHELLYSGILRQGNVNAVNIYIDEVIKICVKYNAKYLIIAHNHPSGDLHPSSNDIRTTEMLANGLEYIHVKLIDHIIFADNKCCSLAQNGLEDLFSK